MGKTGITTCNLIAKKLTGGKLTAEVSMRKLLFAIEEMAGTDPRTIKQYKILLFRHGFAKHIQDNKIGIVYDKPEEEHKEG